MGVNSTLGPIFVGCALSWAFLGILSLQIFLYFQWYRTDPLYLKAFVIFLLLLECAKTGTYTHAAWYFTIAGWGNPQVLMSSPRSLSAAVLLTGFIAFVVQIFFARRLKILSMNSYLSAFIVGISIGQFAAAAIGIARVPDPRMKRTIDVFVVWLAMSAGCDIFIAIGMVYYLMKTRAKILMKSKQDILKRLIGQSIRTGTFMALCAIVNLSFFLAFKNHTVHNIPFFIFGKLYSITALANLNSRQSLVNAGLYVSGAETTSGYVLTDPIDIPWRLHSLMQDPPQFEMATLRLTSAGSNAVPAVHVRSQRA